MRILKVEYDIFASAPDLHEITSAESFWHYKNTLKALEIINKDVTQNFFYFLCVLERLTDVFFI